MAANTFRLVNGETLLLFCMSSKRIALSSETKTRPGNNDFYNLIELYYTALPRVFLKPLFFFYLSNRGLSIVAYFCATRVHAPIRLNFELWRL